MGGGGIFQSRVLCMSKVIHLPAKSHIGGKCSDIVLYYLTI